MEKTIEMFDNKYTVSSDGNVYSLKGIKTLAKKDKEKADQVADEIIKNTYRTLMTRGMKGCYVYCTDTALAEYLKKLLKQK